MSRLPLMFVPTVVTLFNSLHTDFLNLDDAKFKFNE
jgi:hypothetical protein